ncbi:hypothetical protein L195_g021673 [Trifolium pratense]|uniref:Uncharacterized protein n=1 Tax=Trifolium pratense TaxID=57577 RepID=A0A2K3N5T9_TRIPR|nr:hypothetical protein L195_g021673 [Trifolium pratense]
MWRLHLLSGTGAFDLLFLTNSTELPPTSGIKVVVRLSGGSSSGFWINYRMWKLTLGGDCWISSGLGGHVVSPSLVVVEHLTHCFSRASLNSSSKDNYVCLAQPSYALRNVDSTEVAPRETFMCLAAF